MSVHGLPSGPLGRASGLLSLTTQTDINFHAETDQSPVAATRGPRTQAFQINDHLVGEMVGGVGGAGLVTP
jgi:hypothetical protein